MSGLAAGVRLAHFGKKTLILERHDRAGGLNSYFTKGGRELDTGLHAMTNYNPDGPKSAPLARLARQLRLRLSDFRLAPQKGSKVVFPGVALEFDNDFERFTQSVNEAFPAQKDNFQKLVETIKAYDDMDLSVKPVSGRKVVSSIITDPLLVDMIMFPVMTYGSPMENDMEFGLFVVVFKGMFLEGLARPEGGIKVILELLEKRYAESGGELRLLSGVRSIETKDGRVSGVVLDNGERVECDALLSSAGFFETAAMCPEIAPENSAASPGTMSVMESINILDTPAPSLGEDSSVIFFNTSEKLGYRRPDNPIDVNCGVICFPGNFCYDEPFEADIVRVTNIADSEYWMSVAVGEYYKSKAEWSEKSLEAAAKIIPDIRDRIVFKDVFTPKTINRYTGHINGALYGARDKIKEGRTKVDGLYIIGTDQGFLGIVGAMLSGVTVANIALMSSN